ncbi:MAG: DUF1624 domain-containing protein [Acidobacteriota bacterium]|nr:DUF1624 domain-containing protein [Acidobacteriota bacterium]
MAAPGRARRGYLDWLRGLAVLVMIEAHTVDAWTRLSAHGTVAYAWALIIGGFGAPLFLFLAGVAVPLSAGSKTRRSGSARTAASAVCRRGLEIFVLAFLFRLQSFLASPGSTVLGLFKVDILNVMGPAIVAATLVWWAGRTTRGRIVLLTAVTMAVAFVTPLVRQSPAVGLLPVFFQWYVRPVPGHTNFTFFPWSGFVFAGAVLGVLLDEARDASRERLVNTGTLLAGAAMTAFGLWAAWRPSLYAHDDFWTTSPAFFDVRLGIMCLGLAAVYFFTRGSAPNPGSLHSLASRGSLRSVRGPAARAVRLSTIQHAASQFHDLMELMGRESLFVYWIHVEMVYGLLTRPIQHELPLAGTAAAYLIFTFLMYRAVLLKGRIGTAWGRRGQWLSGSQPSLSA